MTVSPADAVGALVAGVLLCAGATKVASPAGLGRALAGLAPAVERHALPLARLVASAEIAAAFLLSVPLTRRAGAAMGIVLGVAFAAAGIAGWIRGLGIGCGCFGRADGRPLGPANIAVGAALVALSAALWWRDGGGWVVHADFTMLSTAGVALALAGWMHRDMLQDLSRLGGRLAKVRSAN
jgi:hypothetical protein